MSIRPLDRAELRRRALEQKEHLGRIRAECDGYDSLGQRRMHERQAARLEERKQATLRRLEAGELDLAWVLRGDKAWFSELRIGKALLATRYLGRLKIRWLAKHSGIRMTKPIGAVPLADREHLILLIAVNFTYVKLVDLRPEQRRLRDRKIELERNRYWPHYRDRHGTVDFEGIPIKKGRRTMR